MEHVNAKYLRALADGKTVEFRLPRLDDDEFWRDVDERSVPADFLISGVQNEDPLWHVELRIKGEE